MDASPPAGLSPALLWTIVALLWATLQATGLIILRDAAKKLAKVDEHEKTLNGITQTIHGPPNGVLKDLDELRDRTHDLGNVAGSHKYRLWTLEQKADIESPSEMELRWGTK